MIRRVMAVLGFWLVFIPFSLSARTVVDRILVQVDDRIITQVAFEEAFAPVRARIEGAGYGAEETAKLVARYREEVLNQMIDQVITDIAVAEAKIEIADQEVDQSVTQFREAHGLSVEDFEKALLAEGMTLDAYRRQTREQMLRARLVNYKVRSKIVITHEEVAAFYGEHPDRFGGGKRYRLAHILLPFPQEGGAEGEKDPEKRAAALVERLRAGEDFVEMARAESVSPIAGPGGELGWFDAKTLSPVIREVIDPLSDGGVSAPVRTPQGFQIFKLLETDLQAPQPLEEVADAISGELYEAEVNRRFREWIMELREKVHVRILN